ncbi:DUF1064 domain-containing protein, partial [Bacillus thuringiensis]|uniref:DUF1064 domain-containing protein n=1 Tax=Bacillus thuringiensis TaxID=1428 RepID=UPI0011A08DBD
MFHPQPQPHYYHSFKIPYPTPQLQPFQPQPLFNLQPPFNKHNKTFQPITYIPDFLLYFPNADLHLIHIKPLITQTFNLKTNLFPYKCPHLHLIFLSHLNKYP